MTTLGHVKNRAVLKLRNSLRSLSWYTDVSLLKPISITFDITDRCQLRCVTCTKWETPSHVQREELDAEEWKSLILKLKGWLGDFSFTFSGGEPFLRKDIFEIISFAAEQGVHPSVISNGYGFSSIVDKIVNSRLQNLAVSLNGVNPQTHDTIRGMEGAYNKTLQFIRDVNLARSKGRGKLGLSVSTILAPFNCDEAVDLVKWVRDEGIDSISFQPLESPASFHSYHLTQSISTEEVSYGRHKDSTVDALRRVRLAEVIDQLIAYKQRGYPIGNSLKYLEWMKVYSRNPKEVLRLKCRVGTSNLSVDPYGNVRLCFNMEPIGNIRFGAPEQLYNNRNSREQRRLIRKCGLTCRILTCNF